MNSFWKEQVELSKELGCPSVVSEDFIQDPNTETMFYSHNLVEGMVVLIDSALRIRSSHDAMLRTCRWCVVTQVEVVEDAVVFIGKYADGTETTRSSYPLVGWYVKKDSIRRDEDELFKLVRHDVDVAFQNLSSDDLLGFDARAKSILQKMQPVTPEILKKTLKDAYYGSRIWEIDDAEETTAELTSLTDEIMYSVSTADWENPYVEEHHVDLTTRVAEILGCEHGDRMVVELLDFVKGYLMADIVVEMYGSVQAAREMLVQTSEVNRYITSKELIAKALRPMDWTEQVFHYVWQKREEIKIQLFDDVGVGVWDDLDPAVRVSLCWDFADHIIALFDPHGPSYSPLKKLGPIVSSGPDYTSQYQEIEKILYALTTSGVLHQEVPRIANSIFQVFNSKRIK